MPKSAQVRPKPKDCFPIIDIDTLTGSKTSGYPSCGGTTTPIRNKYIMSRFEHDLVQFAQVLPRGNSKLFVEGCSVTKNGYSANSKITKSATEKKKGEPTVAKTICLEGCRYDVVRRIALENSFYEVSESDYWNILWTDTPISMEKANDMRRFQQNNHHSFYGPTMTAQKTNHFPGMHEICRKDRLARNLNRMRKAFPEDYAFYPHTWTLPTEIPELLAHFRTNRNQTIICKPDTGCQGKGIFLVRNLKKMNPFAKLIAQIYIPNPLLIDGYKFDLRIYVLITSCDPLRVHVYNEGIARFATVKYAIPNDKNVDVVFMHLTNYSLNKYSQSYVPEAEGSKRKLSTVYGYLLERGLDVEKMVANIDDVIIKTIIAAQPTLRQYYHSTFPAGNPGGSGCFEVLGFDILIDEDLKPWLIEVNLSPSFNLDLPVDAEIKEALLRDTLCKIFLGAIRDTPASTPELTWKSRRKGQMNPYPPEIEIMDKAGNQIPNNFQKQFYHEQLNQGNFRLVYPIDNCFKYSEFLNPEVNVSGVNDMMVPISRREGLPTFSPTVHDRLDCRPIPRSYGHPGPEHFGRQRKSSCQPPKEVVPEESSRPSQAPPIQRKPKMMQKFAPENPRESPAIHVSLPSANPPPRKTKKVKVKMESADEGDMAEQLARADEASGGSRIVSNVRNDYSSSSTPSEFNRVGQSSRQSSGNEFSTSALDASEGSFERSTVRRASPQSRPCKYGVRLQFPPHPVSFENGPKMYTAPTRLRLEGVGDVHSASSEPTRTEVPQPSKNKLVEEWILNGVTSPQRKPKTKEPTAVNNPKWDNFAHETLRKSGTVTSSSQRSYKTTQSLPCPVLAREEFDRKEMLKERERSIRRLGIEGKIFQMMHETGTLSMEEDLIYNKIFSEEEYMANRKGSSTLLEPRSNSVVSSPRPSRARPL